MHRRLRCGVFLTALAFCLIEGVAAGESDDVATGERLAAFLRAGRSVISSHQDLINDPAIGPKNLTGQRVVTEALEQFRRQGKSPAPDTFSESDRKLFDAQIEALREVVDEHQKMIDAKGVGFKGFIPATFARLVNERFEEKVGDQAKIKVTAPVDLVRNRKASPDDWERSVIEHKFLSAGWPKGQPFVEAVDVNGHSSFRMLIPEYYSTSCLTCHGMPKGEVDVTGYPKEGAAEGDLAGAISITLFK